MEKHNQQQKEPGLRLSKGQWLLTTISLTILALGIVNCGGSASDPTEQLELGLANSDLVVMGFNDLGMHCMNQDFSELCILPPFNTLRAQVIKRGDDPQIVSSGALVSFSIPGNTISSTKTNFWDYTQGLFGVVLPKDKGLTGTGLSGSLTPTGTGYYEAAGIPLTPIQDNGTENAYALANVTATYQGATRVTQSVVPVSWEISCNLCHKPRPMTESGGGVDSSSGEQSRGVRKMRTVADDILQKHDKLHGTNLINQKPVLCAKCHADPALGTTGVAGVKTMSAAIHGSHASRMAQANLPNPCYACHPGVKTNCQRDVHYSKGIYCTNCHGGMTAMGSTSRTPWKDQPKCSNCHNVPGHNYEEAGKLFKDSRGHKGVMCVTCHNSPHAITPATTAPDNVQTLIYQNHTGKIDTCSVCHKNPPEEPFFHKIND